MNIENNTPNFKAVDYILNRIKIRFNILFQQQISGINYQDIREDWAYVIKDLTKEQLRKGFDKMIHEEFPPNANKFYELCTKEEKKESIHPSHIFPKLDEPKTSPNVARQNLAKIKMALKIKTFS